MADGAFAPGTQSRRASLHELEILVTTDATAVSTALCAARPDVMTVVFCTYQSLGIIEQAPNEGAPAVGALAEHLRQDAARRRPGDADIFQQAARAVEALSDQCRANAYRPPSANTLTPLAEGQIGGDDGRAPSCQFEDLLLGDPVHGTSVDLAEGLQVRKARFAQPPRGGAWLRGRGPRRPGAVAEQGGS